MKNVVVVGASLAGFRVVAGLRSSGFKGSITLIGAEDLLPYDRPPLSKGVLTDESLPTVDFVPPAWYAENDIELVLGTPASGVDVHGKRVLVGHRSFAYDELVVATGARPRNPFPDAPGNVFTLRTLDDAMNLRQSLQAGRATAIIGGGFIGLEVAAAALKLGNEVTVVEIADIPLSRNIGEDAAIQIGEFVRSQGVNLECGRSVDSFNGEERLTGITLDNGELVRCDVAVIGVGAMPNTEWLPQDSLEIGRLGLLCDSTGRAAPHVWGVGDVSTWRNDSGEPERHEHWTNANDQARVVVMNLQDGGQRTIDSASYVWSDQFGRRLSIIGSTHSYESVRFLNRDTSELAALYASDGKLVGACIADQPRLSIQCRRWVAQGTPLENIPEWNKASEQMLASEV